MEYLYAAESAAELARLQKQSALLIDGLEEYLAYLHASMDVRSLPQCIVWCSVETATKRLSNIPVPAYTNETRTVMCPDIAAWKEIYLHQLDGLSACEAKPLHAYYENLPFSALKQILGHEFVHQSERFPDEEAGKSGIWFEEGMAEYVSRRYFFSASEYAAAREANQRLLHALAARYGGHSLEDFGAATYELDYAGIFYDYWRSFLAVEGLVERYGSVDAVFEAYHAYLASNQEKTLAQWFALE